MNRLSTERRGQVIACLCEGMSIRATVRVTGVAKNTITKLLLDLGEACSVYQDGALTNLACDRVEADEIWSFVGAKQKHVTEDHPDDYGDVWTWTAIDADTKLMVSWLGDTVFVPWGLNAPVKAKIVEIWGDPPAHVRVQLAFDEDDVDSDPVVLLLSPSALQAA